MAFTNFSFPQVLEELNLTHSVEPLFAGYEPLTLAPHLPERLRIGRTLATTINTEKARSEFLIAPLLLELRLLFPTKLGLYSGIDLNSDPARGLNGACDFILTRGPQRAFVQAPVIAITEAKNGNVREGYGQCIAAMVAAQMFNENAKLPAITIYGCASTGIDWQFLRLEGQQLTIDENIYLIDAPGDILGILAWMIQHG